MAWLFLFLEAWGGSDDGSGVKVSEEEAARGEKNHILTVIWNRGDLRTVALGRREMGEICR
jgi:hypothetical protein